MSDDLQERLAFAVYILVHVCLTFGIPSSAANIYAALRRREFLAGLADYDLSLRLSAVCADRRNGLAEVVVDGETEERVLLPYDDGCSRWERLMKPKNHERNPFWSDAVEAAERGNYAAAWRAISLLAGDDFDLTSSGAN